VVDAGMDGDGDHPEGKSWSVAGAVFGGELEGLAKVRARRDGLCGWSRAWVAGD